MARNQVSMAQTDTPSADLPPRNPAKTKALASAMRIILPGRGKVAPQEDRALRPEDREEVFSRLCRLAHGRNYHVAPGTVLGGVFRVRDGRHIGTGQGAQRALAQERVDALLLDRTGWPALVIDFATPDRLTRTGRRRIQQRTRLFHRAGLALLQSGGTETWDQDRLRILEMLSDPRNAPPKAARG